MYEPRDPLGVAERSSLLWIDVDPELVGVIEIGTPRRPGMEVQGRQVRCPRDLRYLGHAELVGMPARGERDARGPHPLRPLLRHPLLVDLLTLDAVGVTP